MASASGLSLLSKDQYNPMKTTTYGTGQLMKAALRYQARKILLAVGGSATVDGGIGAATALGWKFLDSEGTQVPPCGEGLAKIAQIVRPPKAIDIAVEVLCDVQNPLCGPDGAARIYGPQKGATAEMVNKLEAGLANLACLVRKQLNCEIDIAGAGAAGGLAAGAVAFMNAKLVSGIKTIISHSRLEAELVDADWIVTGEGCFDRQSLYGKVVSGIAEVARRTNTAVAVIAGTVDLSRKDFPKLGIATAISCKPENMSLEIALNN
ncbi:MAG: glycerate kinase, partial [Sedimentisphaerales bacterium]